MFDFWRGFSEDAGLKTLTAMRASASTHLGLILAGLGKSN